MLTSEKFKKKVLEVVFDYSEKFYIHLQPHQNLQIGKRGLVGEEAEKGLILVFGPYSYKDFQWDDENIYVSMRFSGVWENLVIPFDSIVSIFDDPISPQFVFSFINSRVDETEESEHATKVNDRKVIKKDEKVIKVKFKKE